MIGQNPLIKLILGHLPSETWSPADQIMMFFPFSNIAATYFVESLKTTYIDKEHWYDIRARRKDAITGDLISSLGIGQVAPGGDFAGVPVP